MTPEESPRYRFGPRSTRGLVAGWRAGQIGIVATGSLAALALVHADQGLAGAAGALGIAGGSLALATVPIGGRTLDSWAPTALRFVAARRRPPAAANWRVGGGRTRGPLGRLRVVALDDGRGGSLGAVVDDEASTQTAVVVAGGAHFALADDEHRAEAVAAWAGVLAALSTEHRTLYRLQWIARTLPGAGGGGPRQGAGSMRAGRHARRDHSDRYEEVVAELAPSLWHRELLVAVTVGAPARDRRPAGREGTRTEPGPLPALVGTVRRRLEAAGLAVGAPLDDTGLGAALRRAYAPAGGTASGAAPFPLGVEARWSHLRTDETVQATYWVAEWPRAEVGPGFLLPLLLGTPLRCTVSMTMAPVPPMSATRRAERERTSGTADAELRRRHGFALTARARAEQETRYGREAELAAGHVLYRFSGYVAVTAPDEVALEQAAAELRQRASLAGLELRRLYGAQEEGWCCTLPTGRGCR